MDRFGILNASGVGTTVDLSLPVNFASEKLVNAMSGGAMAVAAETARRRLG